MARNLKLLLVGALAAFSVLGVVTRAGAQTRYFIVAPSTGLTSASESYVLPLSDPAAIAEARKMAHGLEPVSLGVFALIGPATDGTNRNYLVPGAPAWKWQVTQFVAFVPGPPPQPDNVTAIFGGSPSQVDANASKLASGQYGIFFGGYEVIGELPVQPGVTLCGDWRYSSWLGIYNDSAYPWLFSADRGWFHVHGFDPQDIWFYISGQGYFWTTESIYPAVYNEQTNSWLYSGLP